MTKLLNPASGLTIAHKLVYKTGLFERMRGLLGVRRLPKGEGIILKPCGQIHTFFMLMPIDVIFLDGDMRVLHVRENMPPWRLSPFFMRGVYTVELGARTLAGRVNTGDILAFEA